MDRQTEYAAASELALSGRFREARDSLKALLQDNPAHVEALILLGKVEFYLRHTAASKQCFETALTYEPGSTAAFFGMEYHRRRARLLFLIVCVVLLLASIAAATAFLTHRLPEATGRLDVRLDSSRAALSGSLDRVWKEVEELRALSRGKEERTQQALSEIRIELNRLRQGNAGLLQEVENLRRATSAVNQSGQPVP
jgi:tetratricopeptide (TPR) repeat protein